MVSHPLPARVTWSPAHLRSTPQRAGISKCRCRLENHPPLTDLLAERRRSSENGDEPPRPASAVGPSRDRPTPPQQSGPKPGSFDPWGTASQRAKFSCAHRELGRLRGRTPVPHGNEHGCTSWRRDQRHDTASGNRVMPTPMTGEAVGFRDERRHATAHRGLA